MKKTVTNPFHAKKAVITSALERATTSCGAARILAKELDVPYQVALSVLTLNNRTLKRLCATK